MTTSWRRSAAVALTMALLVGSAVAAPVAAADPAPSGYQVLRGAALNDFRVPTDVRLVSSRTDRRSGLTFERYQQLAAPLGVHVDGAQLSVVRRGDKIVLVIGKHYPGLRATVRPSIAAVRAAAAAALNAPRVVSVRPADLTTRGTNLRIDPETERLFYLVESVAPGVRVFSEVDAQSGKVVEAWSGLDSVEPGQGTGVKGDTKDLTGLTSQVSGDWAMRTAGGKFIVQDANKAYITLRDRTYGGDNDNAWGANLERAAVDAQYYAKQTHDFFIDRFGFDLLNPPQVWDDPTDQWCEFDKILSNVHDPWDDNNAYWDGFSLNYGDGDGATYRAFSGAQDVVAHEFGHAVTECRVPLAYHNHPGALNESFSDIMGSALEWLGEEPLSSNCRLIGDQDRCADWLLGEDLIVGGPYKAIRDLADPESEGQPSHLSDAQFLNSPPSSWNDYGGVHTNSGIPNHAFFLMVEGGRNARCSGPNDSQADCGVMVPPTSLEHATQIAFVAWGDLSTTEAKFCEARDASVAAAQLLYPGSVTDLAATDLAWRAVGIGPCAAGFSVKPAERSVSVAPGAGPVSVGLTLTRGSGHTADVSFSVEDVAPVSASIGAPTTLTGSTTATQVTIDPGGATAGVHPITVFASDGSATPVVVSLSLIIDDGPPTTEINEIRIYTGSVTTGGQVPLFVRWSAEDELSGVVSGSADPGISANANGFRTMNFAPGTYGFASHATDAVGLSASSSRPTTLATLQESAATFAGGWSTSATTGPWGRTRFTKNAGASATFNFNGTDVAWISPRGPKKGRAGVYIDGVLRSTVDLYASSLQERRIVFSVTGLSAGAHTLKIVNRATSGRPRVDVDGFATLAPAP